MDVNEYLPMFLAEAREQLQQLNLAVLRTEANPEDRETIDELFRIAHSLKGMSATMGFDGIAALTHQMEDVLELLRQRTGALDRAGIDVMFDCLDALSGAVDSIEAGDGEQLDATAIVAALSALVRSNDVEQEERAAAAAAAEAAPDEERAPALHVEVALHEQAAMPAVRAQLVLQALARHTEIRRTQPADLTALVGTVFELWTAAGPDPEHIESVVRTVADIADVTVTPVGGEADSGEPAAATGTSRGGGDPSVRPTTTVRVQSERLDQLMHYMGEVVVHRTHVEALVADSGDTSLARAMQDLTRSSQALQSMVMQVRMVPVEAVFLRFPRLVRDLSSRLGKKVEIDLVGKDTELDRTVIDALGEPLVHLVRNSLDHGLETPEERCAAGKPETGRLEIAAVHAGGGVVISVSDDGAGIDPQRIGRKAVERGMLAPELADSLDEAGAAELLFAPGFSTAEEMSDISGRGVGMDAVRSRIRELGGDVLLRSERGRGTRVEVRLPLTLAIISALLIEAADEVYAIPLDRVERTVALGDDVVRSVAGRRVLTMADRVLPLWDGAQVLGNRDGAPNDHAVIVNVRDSSVAVAVGRLVGQYELVTRPLPPQLADASRFSGGAVMSDGSMALIVDCDAIGDESDHYAAA